MLLTTRGGGCRFSSGTQGPPEREDTHLCFCVGHRGPPHAPYIMSSSLQYYGVPFLAGIVKGTFLPTSVMFLPIFVIPSGFGFIIHGNTFFHALLTGS